ncbi:MAG: divergent polysaccharide deacetylase family protein [Candidatus Acidiferrum sp.]
MLQALGGVATAHGLVQEPPGESREGLRFTYRYASVVTHVIHIHLIGAVSSGAIAPRGAEGGHARLAIIIDDLGEDRAAADRIFFLHYPLTLSVLPTYAHSTDIAQDAHARGYQVMLHLPMQSLGEGHTEARELRPGMPSDEIPRVIGEFLALVPDAIGVNNHQGSRATADAALMSQLMPILRERRLFYVDSRTTASTVAYETARRYGVRSAFRSVPFLDDVAEVGAVRRQFALALRGARAKGEAIAIGHPHQATLEALRELLPTAEAQGVRLVFVSELVH